MSGRGRSTKNRRVKCVSEAPIVFDPSELAFYDKESRTKTMDMIPLKPERKAQLEEYAKRRGQDTATALDDALATYLEWERQDFAEAAEGVRAVTKM